MRQSLMASAYDNSEDHADPQPKLWDGLVGFAVFAVFAGLLYAAAG
jgi:hypothetical protein